MPLELIPAQKGGRQLYFGVFAALEFFHESGKMPVYGNKKTIIIKLGAKHVRLIFLKFFQKQPGQPGERAILQAYMPPALLPATFYGPFSSALKDF